MEQSEIHQNALEARVRERQLLCIAFDEIDFREEPFRDCDHLIREIDTGRDGAELPGRSGDIAGPTRHIQQRHGRRDLRCVD